MFRANEDVRHRRQIGGLVSALVSLAGSYTITA
jgi:hypothetical protein